MAFLLFGRFNQATAATFDAFQFACLSLGWIVEMKAHAHYFFGKWHCKRTYQIHKNIVAVTLVHSQGRR